MRVIIKAPLMGERIIELFNNKNVADCTFTFQEKKGMELYFAVEGPLSLEEIVALVKKTIKNTEFGKGIYIAVLAED